MSAPTVLVCGDPARGDDGAAVLALVGDPEGSLPNCRLRAVNQLDVGELLTALAEGGTVIVDAVRGIPEGTIISRPLESIASSALTAASTHALPLPSAVALARALEADLSEAVFVGIGGADYRLGAPLSPSVAAALPALRRAVREALAAIARGERSRRTAPRRGPEFEGRTARRSVTGGPPRADSARGHLPRHVHRIPGRSRRRESLERTHPGGSGDAAGDCHRRAGRPSG